MRRITAFIINVTEDSSHIIKTRQMGQQRITYIYYCNKDVFAYGSFYNSLQPQKNRDGTYTDGKYRSLLSAKDSDGKMVFESVETGDEVVDDST